MISKKQKSAALKRAGVSGLNKPKRTPSHKTKSHVVVTNCKGKLKTIRFGQQGKKVGTVSQVLPVHLRKGESD